MVSLRKLTAPFPWFGGKSRAAELIWSRFGAGIGNYVEPFLGSAAVWLNRPVGFDGWAALNDKDANVSNFWRAMQADPEAVAAAADWPVSEADLHARHLWLVTHGRRLAERLMADPDHFDARAAGWWAWGACAWIGGGWCAGDGPWHAQPDDEGVPVFTLGNGGKGVSRRLPQIGASNRGVHKKLPNLNNNRRVWLVDWFQRLAERLKGARVTCGDWERVCTVNTLTRNGVCGVLLDPPYSTTEPVYANDGREISATVREWCLANGDNRQLRIALCGHVGEHELPGWECVTWHAKGGYQGAEDRERIWFSPACLQSQLEFF